MEFNDVTIYEGTNLGNVLQEIHKNSQSKEKELKKLINDLKPLIETAGDAVIVVPLITSYMNAAIKNDDNLIKMATIVQKAMNSGKSAEDDYGLSDKEKEALLDNVRKLQAV